MKNLLYLLALSVLLVSCKKTDSDPEVKITPTSLEELNVSSNFDWSTADEGILTVQMVNISDGDVSTEDQILLLIDADDQILARSIIKGDLANFNIKLPVDAGQTYYLMYPNSANKQELMQLNGNVNMEFAPSNGSRFAADRSSLVYDRVFAYNYFNPDRPMNRSTHDLGPNLVQNGEFTIDNMERDSRSWTKLRAPGKWYHTNNKATHPTNMDGEMVYYNYSSSYEVIEQSFAVQGGSEYEFSMDFGTESTNKTVGGSLNLYLDNFNANGRWIGETYVSTQGNSISSSGTILNNAVSFQFYIGLYAGNWVDNVEYKSVDVNPDSDGDGVNDVGDDFPNDPTKAYKIKYPTSGLQSISFEDLWPSKGDYDFNDLVISFNAEYALNADGQYVSAVMNFDIDAAGGSTPLGLGLQLLDGNKQEHSTTFITGVTGQYSSLDPDVNNGIIVFNNRHEPMTNIYTNTDDVLTGEPVTVTCELELNPDFQGVALPNIYAFYTEERGREIHLPSMPPTPAANTSLFGTYDDHSGTHYRTENGLPWAIEVVQSTKVYYHPLEKVKITEAYTNFLNWANTNGAQNETWFNNKIMNKVYVP